MITHRHHILASAVFAAATLGVRAKALPGSLVPAAMRIAFLHLAPRSNDLEGNRQRVCKGVLQAADAGAKWVLTPELSTSGYSFAETLGLTWITSAPAPWVSNVKAIAADRGMTVYLAEAERDAESGLLYNSLLAVDGERGFVGCHRKINTLKVGSEAWSSPGSVATVVSVHGFGKVGLLICADACSPQLAVEMKSHGALALLSSANWAPGAHGPAGEWENITASTGLPMFVCNRTGEDSALSFSRAESVVVAKGIRQLSFSSAQPALILVDWDFETNRLVNWSHTELR